MAALQIRSLVWYRNGNRHSTVQQVQTGSLPIETTDSRSLGPVHVTSEKNHSTTSERLAISNAAGVLAGVSVCVAFTEEDATVTGLSILSSIDKKKKTARANTAEATFNLFFYGEEKAAVCPAS